MVGYRYLHSAIDDQTRIVYSEILDNEQASTAAGFWAARRLVPIDRDSRRAGRHRQRALLPLGTVAPGMRRDRDHREQDPALPAPNKRQDRAIPPDPLRGMGLHSALDLRNPTGRAYTGFVHFYNHHRPHGALGWATPTSILKDNLPAMHN